MRNASAEGSTVMGSFGPTTLGVALSPKRYRVVLVVLLVLTLIAAGLVVVHSFDITVVLLALSCTVIIFLLARAEPAFPMIVALFALAFIPVYWIPYKYHIFPNPGVMLLLAIVAGGLANTLLFSKKPILSQIDILIALFFIVSLMCVVLGVRKQGDLTTNLLQWLVPYLAARYLVGNRISYTSFAKIFCATTLATLPFVYVEAATGYNPFQKLVVQPGLGELWAHELYRDGEPRAEAAFGHPIALSMFLITGAILAFALAFRPDARQQRTSWLIASGLLIVGQALTLSRTGWIMLLAALICGAWIAISKPVSRVLRARVAATFAMGSLVVGILMGFSATTREGILSIFGSDREASTSAQARENILAASNQYFSWFGHQADTLREVGIKSVDNTYVLLTEQWGIIAAALIALMSVPMIVYLIRLRQMSMGGVLVVVALANLVGLIFVAPITQEQNIVFMFLGAASAVLACSRRQSV
jgi:hypothetical protein